MSNLVISPQDLGAESEADMLRLAEILSLIGNASLVIPVSENQVRWITNKGSISVEVGPSGIEIESGSLPYLTMRPCPSCASLNNFINAEIWLCVDCGMAAEPKSGKLITIQP